MVSTALEVKVVPGARRDALAGWLGDALKLRVSAPPEKGRANEAVVQLVADVLGVSPRCVAIVSGHSSPRKRLVIEGLDAEALRARIDEALG